jgi:hypothetical protein
VAHFILKEEKGNSALALLGEWHVNPTGPDVSNLPDDKLMVPTKHREILNPLKGNAAFGYLFY